MTIEKYQEVNKRINKKEIFLNNFLGGLAWGLGSVVGATIVVALLISLLKFVNFIPILGNFSADIIKVIDSKTSEK